MTPVERFHRTARFEPVDRLPLIEWAPWPERTLSRWYTEGLPREVHDPREVCARLGLDGHRRLRLFARGAACPPPPPHGAGLVEGADGYRALRGHLYPRPRLRTHPAAPELGAWAREHEQGASVVSVTLDGFCWYPRTLLGAERHFYAFYDDPALVHAINGDLADYVEWAIDEVCRSVTPDFVVFTEVLSHGPGRAVTREQFDEFLAPYYRRVLPALSGRGIATLVAADGELATAAPWFEEIGVNGAATLERRSGADALALRAARPRFLLMGGVGAGLLCRGPELSDVRAELERLLPVMRSGGFFPGLDCGAPAAVPLERYRSYVALLAEYCGRAGAGPGAGPAAGSAAGRAASP